MNKDKMYVQYRGDNVDGLTYGYVYQMLGYNGDEGLYLVINGNGKEVMCKFEDVKQVPAWILGLAS